MATKVKLQLVDALQLPLDDHTVTVDVFSMDNTIHFQAIVPVTGDPNVTISLEDCPPGTYRFQLWPTNYQMIQFFLALQAETTVVRDKPCIFPVDPQQVINIGAPPFGNLPQKLQDFLNRARINAKDGSIVPDGDPAPSAGDDLYSALPPLLKAALLNLYLKSANTVLPDGSTCFDHLNVLREQDQDRLYVTVDLALFQQSATSPDLHSVDFSLHKELLGYKLFSSFKTFDAAGNLQLTFSRKNGDLFVDMDIDEAQGLGHAYEVVRNIFTGLTNPYNIREILVGSQGLRPLYSFVFPEKKIATVAAAAAGAGAGAGKKSSKGGGRRKK